MIAFIVTTYTFIEIINYKKYTKKYKLFNDFSSNDIYEKTKLNKKIDVIHKDIKHSHAEFKSFIQEMFKEFKHIEKIPKLSIIKCFIDNLCVSTICNDIHEKIKSMANDVENTIGIKFADVDNQLHPIKYVNISKGKLISWYRPIFFQWCLSFIRTISSIHMQSMGFNKNVLNDGVIVWAKKTTSPECFLFAPSCIGGITFYQLFIKSLCNKFSEKNIYVLEIPGMAWTSYSSALPPSVSKVSSIVSNFIIENKIRKIDMFGHSFGTIILNHIANEQYSHLKENNVQIKKMIYIEGLLFYVKVFKTLSAIEMPLLDVLLGNNKSDIFTMPLFQRDLHVKFYIKRYLSLSNSILCGDSQCEAECNFYALMAENDNKFITKDYVDYIEKKQLNINYKVFEECSHGSFVWTSKMHQHLFDILSK